VRRRQASQNEPETSQTPHAPPKLFEDSIDKIWKSGGVDGEVSNLHDSGEKPED